MILYLIYGFLVGYLASFAVITLYGLGIQRNKEKGYESKSEIDPTSITVIVPFRNEEQRISGLLKSIRNLRQLPAKFIFVDDHSDDNTSGIIREQLENVSYEIIRLEDAFGKKQAIRSATKIVETEYILTWDADVEVNPMYFDSISKLSHADMYVLPAILNPASFSQGLYEFDVVVANAVNAGISGWKRPIFASGANLLYKAEAFKKWDDFASHESISSGDDTFLLRDFVRAGADVRLHTSPELAIYTETPQSLKEYIEQRLRWISKTNALNDFLNTFIATLQFVFTLIFIGLIVVSCIYFEWTSLGFLIAGKVLADFVLFVPYFRRTKRMRTFLLLPIAELWFPILSIILAVLIPFYNPKWKGRRITAR